MKSTGISRWSLAAVTVAAIAIDAIAFCANAQSEFMRGDRMPYDAFDRLPKTDLEIAGGTIHVAFAPGDMALPKEKVLDWVRMSAKAVTAYYGRFPVCSLQTAAGAGRRRPRSRRNDLGLSGRRHPHSCLGANPPRMICGATG